MRREPSPHSRSRSPTSPSTNCPFEDRGGHNSSTRGSGALQANVSSGASFSSTSASRQPTVTASGFVPRSAGPSGGALPSPRAAYSHSSGLSGLERRSNAADSSTAALLGGNGSAGASITTGVIATGVVAAPPPTSEFEVMAPAPLLTGVQTQRARLFKVDADDVASSLRMRANESVAHEAAMRADMMVSSTSMHQRSTSAQASLHQRQHSRRHSRALSLAEELMSEGVDLSTSVAVAAAAAQRHSRTMSRPEYAVWSQHGSQPLQVQYDPNNEVFVPRTPPRGPTPAGSISPRAAQLSTSATPSMVMGPRNTSMAEGLNLSAIVAQFAGGPNANSSGASLGAAGVSAGSAAVLVPVPKGGGSSGAAAVTSVAANPALAVSASSICLVAPGGVAALVPGHARVQSQGVRFALDPAGPMSGSRPQHDRVRSTGSQSVFAGGAVNLRMTSFDRACGVQADDGDLGAFLSVRKPSMLKRVDSSLKSPAPDTRPLGEALAAQIAAARAAEDLHGVGEIVIPPIPNDSGWKQQTLPSWRPIVTVWCYGFFLILVAAVCVPFGIVALVSSNDSKSVIVRYDTVGEYQFPKPSAGATSNYAHVVEPDLAGVRGGDRGPSATGNAADGAIEGARVAVPPSGPVLFHEGRNGARHFQGKRHTVRFTLTKALAAPVQMSFRIHNMLQGYMDVDQSRCATQLAGATTNAAADMKKCDPYQHPGRGGGGPDVQWTSTTTSAPTSGSGSLAGGLTSLGLSDNDLFDSGSTVLSTVGVNQSAVPGTRVAGRAYGTFTINPCGVMPWSMFNDTFVLRRVLRDESDGFASTPTPAPAASGPLDDAASVLAANPDAALFYDLTTNSTSVLVCDAGAFDHAGGRLFWNSNSNPCQKTDISWGNDVKSRFKLPPNEDSAGTDRWAHPRVRGGNTWQAWERYAASAAGNITVDAAAALAYFSDSTRRDAMRAAVAAALAADGNSTAVPMGRVPISRTAAEWVATEGAQIKIPSAGATPDVVASVHPARGGYFLLTQSAQAVPSLYDRYFQQHPSADPYFNFGWYDGEAGHAVPVTDDLDLMNWVRTAPLNRFEKLHRLINVPLQPGTYELDVLELYDTFAFSGSKYLVLESRAQEGYSSPSLLRNTALGILVMVTGIAAVLLFVAMVAHATTSHFRDAAALSRLRYKRRQQGRGSRTTSPLAPAAAAAAAGAVAEDASAAAPPPPTQLQAAALRSSTQNSAATPSAFALGAGVPGSVSKTEAEMHEVRRLRLRRMQMQGASGASPLPLGVNSAAASPHHPAMRRGTSHGSLLRSASHGNAPLLGTPAALQHQLGGDASTIVAGGGGGAATHIRLDSGVQGPHAQGPPDYQASILHDMMNVSQGHIRSFTMGTLGATNAALSASAAAALEVGADVSSARLGRTRAGAAALPPSATDVPLRLRNLFLHSAHNGLATLQQVPTEEDISMAMAAGEQAATASMNHSIARLEGASMQGLHDLSSVPATTVVSLAGSPARLPRPVAMVNDSSATNAATSGGGGGVVVVASARGTTQDTAAAPTHARLPNLGTRSFAAELDDGHSARHVRVDSDANILNGTLAPSQPLPPIGPARAGTTLAVVPATPLRHEQQPLTSPVLPGAITSPLLPPRVPTGPRAEQAKPALNAAMRRAAEAEAARGVASSHMVAVMSASAPLPSASAEVPVASPASRLTPSATTLAAPNLQGGGGRGRPGSAATHNTAGTRAPGPTSVTPQPVAVRQPLIAPPADELDDTASHGSNDSVQRR